MNQDNMTDEETLETARQDRFERFLIFEKLCEMDGHKLPERMDQVSWVDRQILFIRNMLELHSQILLEAGLIPYPTYIQRLADSQLKLFASPDRVIELLNDQDLNFPFERPDE